MKQIYIDPRIGLVIVLVVGGFLTNYIVHVIHTLATTEPAALVDAISY